MLQISEIVKKPRKYLTCSTNIFTIRNYLSGHHHIPRRQMQRIWLIQHVTFRPM